MSTRVVIHGQGPLDPSATGARVTIHQPIGQAQTATPPQEAIAPPGVEAILQLQPQVLRRLRALAEEQLALTAELAKPVPAAKPVDTSHQAWAEAALARAEHAVTQVVKSLDGLAQVLERLQTFEQAKKGDS